MLFDILTHFLGISPKEIIGNTEKTKFMKIFIMPLWQFIIHCWIKSIGQANGRVQKWKSVKPLEMLLIKCFCYLGNMNKSHVKLRKKSVFWDSNQH